MVFRSAALLAILFAASTVMACTDDGAGAPSPTTTNTPVVTSSPQETASSTQPATVTPEGGGRTTGIAELDALIDAVESRDLATLRGLLEFEALECTRALGAGGPPKCAEGEDEGTEVRVFPVSTCEPEWRREAGADSALQEVVAIGPVRLAAFDAPDGYLRADAEYVVVFAGPDPRLDGAAERGVAIGVRDGRIVEIRLACGAGDDPASLIPEDQGDFLLPPPA